MTNTTAYTLLAGNPKKWDDEITAASKLPGFDLVAMQVDQHNRGRRSAHLCRSIKGFSVRAASGLDDFRLLASSNNRGAAIDGTKQAAIEWGKAWANEDPDNREFYSDNRTLAENDIVQPA